MDKQTIETYNQLAETYDQETTDFWDKFPHTIIDKFVEYTKGKVLDVGSGPGRDGLLLQNKGLDVVCLDASMKMVKLSEGRGLKSVVGDFNNLPFENESFDGVWAYTSLLHVPKSEVSKAFSEIKRVLKANGVFGLGLVEGETELYRESSEMNQLRWFSFYKKEEIEKILSDFGFEILSFKEFKPASKNYFNYICRKI